VTGDAAAVFQAQRGRLFGLAYRLLGSASDAEDVLQDAFLHEAFGYRYGEISGIIGRSEAVCRQLGHRAAARLREEPGARSRPARFTPVGPAEAAQWRRLTGQFLAAAAAGDVAGLERLLADDVVSWSDGGGKVPAGLRPVRGREKVARLFAALGPALVPGGKRTPGLAYALGDLDAGGWRRRRPR
jgi:SnoaL-like domain/Sigma-70 region 2